MTVVAHERRAPREGPKPSRMQFVPSEDTNCILGRGKPAIGALPVICASNSPTRPGPPLGAPFFEVPGAPR